MTSRQINISISGGMCRYHDEPDKDLAYLTVATGFAALISVALLRPSAEIILATLLFVVLVSLAVFLAKTVTTSVEIDRDNGEIRTARNFYLITLRRNYPLREFDNIQTLAQDEPVEDGYRIIRYSVVLSGKSRSLEVCSADAESEGKAIQKELSEFLGLNEQQGGSGSSSS